MSRRLLFPVSFVNDLETLLFHLLDFDLGPFGNALRNSIDSQLNEKLYAVEKHRLFSLYKSAPPGSIERNCYRLQYLDFVYTHSDWRSSDETPL